MIHHLVNNCCNGDVAVAVLLFSFVPGCFLFFVIWLGPVSCIIIRITVWEKEGLTGEEFWFS